MGSEDVHYSSTGLERAMDRRQGWAWSRRRRRQVQARDDGLSWAPHPRVPVSQVSWGFCISPPT